MFFDLFFDKKQKNSPVKLSFDKLKTDVITLKRYKKHTDLTQTVKCGGK